MLLVIDSRWVSAFEYNGRYELDLGPLKEEVKKAQQRLFGPAHDFAAIEKELAVQMGLEKIEKAHIDEEMQAAIDNRKEVVIELCKQVDEERDAAAEDALDHIKACELRFGRSIWQQIVDGGDPVPEGAIENAKTQSEEELAGNIGHERAIRQLLVMHAWVYSILTDCLCFQWR